MVLKIAPGGVEQGEVEKNLKVYEREGKYVDRGNICWVRDYRG